MDNNQEINYKHLSPMDRLLYLSDKIKEYEKCIFDKKMFKTRGDAFNDLYNIRRVFWEEIRANKELDKTVKYKLLEKESAEFISAIDKSICQRLLPKNDLEFVVGVYAREYIRHGRHLSYLKRFDEIEKEKNVVRERLKYFQKLGRLDLSKYGDDIEQFLKAYQDKQIKAEVCK